jgi:hypothetical protein
MDLSLITDHNSQKKAYGIDLSFPGVTNQNVEIYSHIKAYTGRPAFLTWLTDLFLAEVARRREAMRDQGRAALIMDMWHRAHRTSS